MFKYKSPLSRLLEGAGKAKEEDVAETPAAPEEQSEPIADFNALRAALAGGNLSSGSYEETEELIPEEKMPDFEEAAEDTDGEAPAAEPVAEAPAVEVVQDDEPVVALRLSGEAMLAPEDTAEDIPTETEIATPEVETPEIDAVEPPQVDVVEAPVEAAQPDPEPPVAEEPQVVAAIPVPTPAPAPAEDRRARVKTTFLGFERADTHVQDLIETAEPVTKAEAVQETFPVGWLVVTGGPGRGASVTLTEGLMQIGRNDDQAIQLDFGDTGISRSNHAVIAYDPEDRKCYLGHGGKANLVRLNGKPVLSTVALVSGDLIRISETSLRFAAFCDDSFDWRDEK